MERRGALYDLIAEWVGDDTTYQAAQTKKVYRATLERLAGWLVAQGHPATPAGLTAARIDAYLTTLEPEQRGARPQPHRRLVRLAGAARRTQEEPRSARWVALQVMVRQH